ncbi:TSUP family transporter [Rappaport israeli]|uniref:TSUP family transporter n=1 Tax=Rappaport israeli TaxID=1839807 RepID=UPI001E44C37D|nr:TSUP family transporter [Rappaport israeli]
MRGLTLQQATIEAKAFNAITNLTSLAIFSLTGNIVWQVGLTMAIGQLIGARLASGLIMRQGNRLIRPIVVSMSIVMSAILAYKYWF